MKSLKELKQEIDKAEMKEARLQGAIGAEEKRLKKDYCSPNNYKSFIKDLDKRIKDKKKQLKKGVQSLEKKI